MPQDKRIVIVAGEESGDAHAASFVKALLKKNPNLILSGIGGKHMEDAGVHLISDLARYGVTGLSEVIRHFIVIRRAFNDIKKHLSENKPDLLVLVDYPGFNLRLAQFAKHELGIPVLYYISPQIWAWKANRIHTIRRCVDHMAVILPFEKQLYEKAGVPVSFVGHPLVESVQTKTESSILRQQFNLPLNQRLIAMLPGSRVHEIERLMPVLSETMQKLLNKMGDLHFVIPVARTIDLTLIKSYLTQINSTSYTLIKGHSVETVACSDCVVVASGTASLECALLKKPMCIIYKGSMLSYIAAMKLIKVRYLGLCNLLQNEMIAPELLQYDCNVTELTRTLTTLLNDEDTKQRMVKRLQRLSDALSSQAADCSIEQLIMQFLDILPALKNETFPMPN